MGFFDRFSRKAKVGDMNDILRGLVSPTKSGMSVSADSALRCSAVYSCISVISESIAQLPLALYRRESDGSRKKVTNHPLYPLLHDQPNEWQTAFEFWEQLTTQVALRGNAYARVVRGVGGKVIELLPLDAWGVNVVRGADLSLRYEVSTKSGTVTLRPDEVMHLRYRTLNGYMGLSPIAYNRETVGLAMAATELGGQVLGNGAMVSGVLTIPGALSKEAIDRLRDAWIQTYHGTSNAGKTAVLDNGAKWERVAMTAEDTQYIESRKMTRSEIAAIYRVPPHKIGDLDKATFSNIEHQNIEFVTQTVVPWARRFEQAISRDLLTDEERQTLYPEFMVDGLMRGDSSSRAQFYKEMFMVGALSANEIREKENQNRIGPEGDVRYVPSNLMPLGASGPQSGDKTNA